MSRLPTRQSALAPAWRTMCWPLCLGLGALLAGAGLSALWFLGLPELAAAGLATALRLAAAWLALGVGLMAAIVALSQLSRQERRAALEEAAPEEATPVPGVTDAVPPPAMRPPEVVAIGGGHGLETLLRGLKLHPCHLTAIVTVADDGGSSGVLRRDMGMLPPGDVRRCMAALAEAEPLMAQLMEYRFGQGAGLDGHAFGNLFLAAMVGITGGFDSAVAGANRVLAVRGRVLPASLDDVTLCAEVRARDGSRGRDGSRLSSLVRGQSQIAKARGIVERVYLEPATAKGHPQAVRALLNADLILIGPGSLYTSVVPNLLVPEIREALCASPALKVYICNVATQPGETDGYTMADHVRALRGYMAPGSCDCVLANSNTRVPLAASMIGAMPSELVQPEGGPLEGCTVVTADLVDAELPWRHDPHKLAVAVWELLRAHRPARAGHRDGAGA
ncbi:MAG: gluconeogenesis factor YvcK family protein [Chloroflexota bacterium]